MTGKYESRRFVALATEDRPRTEFFEYHWAHLMQGNRLADLWPTFRRLLFRWPWRVPRGLRGSWLLFWAAAFSLAVLAVAITPLAELPPKEWGSVVKWLTKWVGITGILGVVVAYVLLLAGKALPRAVTKSFVDVVRYLDTSPRSYEVRHQIRKGFVELLEALHKSEYEGKPRYGRIVIVAHSLGAYIAYDGICHLWATINDQARPGQTGHPAGLSEVVNAAAGLKTPTDKKMEKWQGAQHQLWRGLREQGNPWLITDFISVGTPMYFADLLYTRKRTQFDERVKRRELPTCPPERYDSPEGENNRERRPRYSYTRSDRLGVLYDGAPFAFVRWTNMWFPAWPERFGFFGDWFGGPLQELFGIGIKDIPVKGNRGCRWLPGYAHALYFKFPMKRDGGSVTEHLDVALRLRCEPPDAATNDGPADGNAA